jgi:hypothetical protein
MLERSLGGKMNKIIVNAIECNSCHTVCLSVHVHDYRECQCGKVAADGGTEYLKRTGKKEDATELSLVLCDDKRIRRESQT